MQKEYIFGMNWVKYLRPYDKGHKFEILSLF